MCEDLNVELAKLRNSIFSVTTFIATAQSCNCLLLDLRMLD